VIRPGWRAWRRFVAALLLVLPVEYAALYVLAPGRLVGAVVTVGCWRYGCPPVTVGFPVQ
jgi:hypothetical protein